MYPSGAWRGFWQQEGFGRQPMEEFHLTFDNGAIRGRGVDIVGAFTFRGEYDAKGAVSLVKQYLGKHAVTYLGSPDGEGSILGTWTIEQSPYKGPFLMQPVRETKVSDLPIRDL